MRCNEYDRRQQGDYDFILSLSSHLYHHYPSPLIYIITIPPLSSVFCMTERKRYGYFHGHDPDEDAEDEGILWSADPRKKENLFTFLYQVLINYKELKISPSRVHTSTGGSINPNTSKGTGSIRQSSVTLKQKSLGQQQSMLITSSSAKQVKIDVGK